MRSKKGVFNLGTDFENTQTPDPQPCKLEYDVVMPQAKNTFLTTYDPLESIYWLPLVVATGEQHKTQNATTPFLQYSAILKLQ